MRVCKNLSRQFNFTMRESFAKIFKCYEVNKSIFQLQKMPQLQNLIELATQLSNKVNLQFVESNLEAKVESKMYERGLTICEVKLI